MNNEPQVKIIEFPHSQDKVVQVRIVYGGADVQVPPAPPRPRSKLEGYVDLGNDRALAFDIKLIDNPGK